MKADLILYNIGTLVTSRELIKQILIMEWKILRYWKCLLSCSWWKNTWDWNRNIPENLKSEWTKLIDIEKVVTPGIIDSHTSVLHYGSREKMNYFKIKGVPYLEILRNGGGILSTVRATRKATRYELFDKSIWSIE